MCSNTLLAGGFKVSRKVLSEILVGLAVGLVVGFALFVANSFFGNPISASLVRKNALAYLDDEYGHLDLIIEKVVYNPKDSSYLIPVSSATSVDTHFSLSFRSGRIFNDDYEISVLSGANTMDRLCDEYENSLTPLVIAEIDDVTSLSVLPEKIAKYDFDLDSPFDKGLVENVTVMINCTGGTDAKHLSQVLGVTYDVMKQNGYDAIGFGITGEHQKSVVELINIKSSHVVQKNLREILQKAITNAEYDGIIAFSKGLE